MIYLPAYLIVLFVEALSLVSESAAERCILVLYHLGFWQYIDDAIWHAVIYGDDCGGKR